MERNVIETYTAAPPTETETVRQRREANLVNAYADHLRAQGHTVCRHTIAVEGELLVTDLFDETRRELIEAKSSADRGVLRLALGQILDYARFVQPDSLAVLVPCKPSEDLRALLKA